MATTCSAPSTPRRDRRLRAAVALGAGLAAAGGALGATPNRVIDEIAAVPSVTEGTYDIHVKWYVELGDEPGPQNMATRVKLFKNGALVGTLAQWIVTEVDGLSCGVPGDCATGKLCGFVLTNGIDSAYCIEDGFLGTCTCQSGSFGSTFPGQDVGPGDVIMAVLEPLGQGALPDFPGDNTLVKPMVEGGMAWNRTMKSAKIVENDAGEQVLRLEVGVFSYGFGNEPQPLDFDVKLRAGPLTFEPVTVPISILPFDSCFFGCVPFGCPTPISAFPWIIEYKSFCLQPIYWPGGWYPWCHCMHFICIDLPPFVFDIPNWDDLFVLDDLILPEVLIEPVPGLAGELITADDAVAITPFVPVNDCPEDLNQDGLVNSPDLNQLLSKFNTPCGP